MPLQNYKPARTILRTIDGKVIVRPLAPGIVHFGERMFAGLSEEGEKAWNAGEDLEMHHFNAWGDLIGLARIEFA